MVGGGGLAELQREYTLEVCSVGVVLLYFVLKAHIVVTGEEG